MKVRVKAETARESVRFFAVAVFKGCEGDYSSETENAPKGI